MIGHRGGGEKPLEKSIWKDKSLSRVKAGTRRGQQLRPRCGGENPEAVRATGRSSQAVPRCRGRTSRLLALPWEGPSVTAITRPVEQPRCAELSFQLLLSLTGLGGGK